MRRNQSRSFIELIELTDIQSNLGGDPKSISLLGKLDKSESLEARLYREIARAKGADEKTVVSALGLALHPKEYSVAKSHLRQSLFDHLFFLDLKEAGHSEYSQKLYSMRRAVLHAQVLERAGANQTLMDITKKALVIATEIEDWQSALTLIPILRNQASLSGEEKEFQSLINQETRFEQLAHAEREVKQSEERLYLVFARSGAEHPELLPEIEEAIEKLEPMVNEFGTYKLQKFLLRLKRFALQVRMNYHEAIQICNENEQLLNDFPLFQSKSEFASFARTRLICTVQLQDYEDAKRAAEECTKLQTEGENNWYYFKVWHVILHMRLEAFDDAFQECTGVMKSKNFPAQPENVKDRFALMLLYSELFSGRKIPWTEQLQEERPGEIARKVMQLAPSLKGDYAGFHMEVVVLEILIILMRRFDRPAFIARIESLQMYRSRHLNKTHSTQSNLFIQLLQLAVTLDFEADAIRKAAKPILAEMASIKEIDTLEAEMVLPYAMMWSKISAALPKKKRRQGDRPHRTKKQAGMPVLLF